MLVTPRLPRAVPALSLLTIRARPDAHQVLRGPDDDSQGVDLFGAHLSAATNPDDLAVDYDGPALVSAHCATRAQSSPALSSSVA